MKNEACEKAGSSPAIRTNFVGKNDGSGGFCTEFAQNHPHSKLPKVKFPQTIEHRGHKAKIYGRRPGYDYYRVSYRASGKRILKSFPTYAAAKQEAEKAVRDLWQGSQAAALTRMQADEALAVLKHLEQFNRETGQRLSALEAVSQFTAAARKLGKATLGHCVDRYLAMAGTIVSKGVAEAVEAFIAEEKAKTVDPMGKRPEISPKYAYNRSIQLRRFAASFPNTDLASLTKAHTQAFIQSLAKFSAKSRNHHRAALAQFFDWCVARDFLPEGQSLSKELGRGREKANDAKISRYTPGEFAALLGGSEGAMRALIAIGGLAGLRTAELLRLDWADVWRVKDHIDVTALNAKTRQRRKVEIGPALAQWLEPFRGLTAGKVWVGAELSFHREFSALCKRLEIGRKANGLRHGFATYLYAVCSDENKTAKQCGNSPAMIFAHYSDAATQPEGLAWFAVAPDAAELAQSRIAQPVAADPG